MSRFHAWHVLDLLVALIFLAAIVVSFVHLFQKKTGAALLVIATKSGEWVYPLQKNATHSVEGLLGVSRIVVQDGAAHFEQSPCPNQFCVQGHAISQNGEWAACLPNNVFIRIEAKDAAVDAVAF
ncbi:MAG: NusG domain II-containing protein [Treponema sp.]|nr:NusG domain II-containing protein [Treponema sp.]